MGFVVHKLKQETLSEYLASIRMDLGYSLEAVSAACDILPKYLKELEEGTYDKLPEMVYVVGFLKKLARLYRVSEVELINQYKREFDTRHASLKSERSTWKSFVNIPWLPKQWTFRFGGLAFMAVVVVLGYQVISIAMVPKLKLISPIEGQSYTSGVVEVLGESTPGSEISVNNQLVYAGEDGKFSVSMGVLSGAQSLSIKAVNRFGKEVKQIVNFAVSDGKSIGTAGPAMPPVVLGVKTGSGVVASVTLKGVSRPINQTEGTYKYFASTNTILLTTSDAGNTRVVWNGRELGNLGKPGEVLSNVAFTPQAPQADVGPDHLSKLTSK